MERNSSIEFMVKRLAEIDAELAEVAKATLGPWTAYDSAIVHTEGEGGETFDYQIAEVSNDANYEANAVFIARSREGWPQSLESEKRYLTALRAVLELCDKSEAVAKKNGWGALIGIHKIRSAIDSAWEKTKCEILLRRKSSVR